MSAPNLVELSAGRLILQLFPSVGGGIRNFHWSDGDRRVPVLRECNTRDENVLELGNFPLVPFVNRIRGGRFAFRGREVRLAPNMPADQSPLHGQGWLSAWTVERASASEALLSFRHEPGEWPWAYAAEQVFALDDSGLSLSLTCRNLADEPMPCGLGQHPYFPCTPETLLDTRVDHAWTIDEHVLPVEKVPAQGRYALSDRAICGQELDHGFGGWSGDARMSDPSWPFDLLLSSPGARFFQVFSPPAGGFFVAEPVSHANAALNAPEEEWPELGMQVLEPGEHMRLDMRLEVRAS